AKCKSGVIREESVAASLGSADHARLVGRPIVTQPFFLHVAHQADRYAVVAFGHIDHADLHPCHPGRNVGDSDLDASVHAADHIGPSRELSSAAVAATEAVAPVILSA